MSLESWAAGTPGAQVGVGSRSLYDRVFPPVGERTSWHVSPVVDLFGYGFSWLLVAIPIYWMLGSETLRPRDYRVEGLILIASGVVLFDVHRHFTFPYVFLDRSVRARFPVRVFLVPLLLLGLLTQLPSLSYDWTLVSVPGVAAVGAWLGLFFQTLRHDGMGSQARRRALVCTGASVALAVGLGRFSDSIPFFAWVMLLLPVSASLLLSGLLVRSLREGGSGFGDVQPKRGRSGLLPAGMLSLVALAALSTVAAGDVLTPVATIVNAIFVAYVAWLVHHGMSQKYGILRLYSSKSGQDTKVPGWVDRWIAWSWVPMMLVWAAGSAPDTVRAYLDNQSAGASAFIMPLIDFTDRNFALTMVGAALPIVGSLTAFLYYEWKVHELRNRPRLGYVAGTTLLFSSMFPLGAAGLYICFAWSHSIEYMTFIWAFQRKRYAQPTGEAPALEHITRHPLVYFSVGVVVLLAVFGMVRFIPVYGLESIPYVFGYPLTVWVFWYSIMQALIHFYYDGFLWKLRRPELARSI